MAISIGLIILLGCVGGLVPDALRIVRSRHRRRFPRYLKYPNFWVSLVVLVGLGGLAAWLLEARSVKEALAYGFGAPEIIARLFAKTSEEVDRGVEEERPSLREWWAT